MVKKKAAKLAKAEALAAGTDKPVPKVAPKAPEPQAAPAKVPKAAKEPEPDLS